MIRNHLEATPGPIFSIRKCDVQTHTEMRLYSEVEDILIKYTVLYTFLIPSMLFKPRNSQKKMEDYTISIDLILQGGKIHFSLIH